MTALEVRVLAEKIDHVVERLDAMELREVERAKEFNARLTDVEKYRERMRGAGAVFALAAPTISGLIVAYFSK